MMGETGEEQMHIVLGKQRSECEPNAPIPQEIRDNAVMGMMMGGGTRTNRRNTTPGNGFTNSLSMMHYGFAPFGWIFMLLFRGLVILGGIFLVKRLMHQQTGHHHEGKSALDILKERYAHGKIDKQEFEEKKKDLM